MRTRQYLQRAMAHTAAAILLALCCCSLIVPAVAAPPALLRASWNSALLRLPASLAHDASVSAGASEVAARRAAMQPLVSAVRMEMCFDQALRIDGVEIRTAVQRAREIQRSRASGSFSSAEEATNTAAVFPGLGLTRLRCGHSLLESHPPSSWASMLADESAAIAAAAAEPHEDRDDEGRHTAESPLHEIPLGEHPSYLWPFFPLVSPPFLPANVSTLFAQGSGQEQQVAPNCFWQVFVLPAAASSSSGSSSSKAGAAAPAVDVGGCTLSFLPAALQDWTAPGAGSASDAHASVLSNLEGEPFEGEVVLPFKRDRKMAVFHSPQQQAAAAAQQRAAQEIGTTAAEKVAATGAASAPSSSFVFSASSAPSKAQLSLSAPSASLDASAFPVASSPSLLSSSALDAGALDSESLVFLQAWDSFRSMEEVTAKQTLEKIIEPTTMVCIPLMVSMSAKEVGPTITKLVTGILGPLLVDPLLQPTIAALTPAIPEDMEPAPELETSDPETDGSAEGGADAGDWLAAPQGGDHTGYNTFLDTFSSSFNTEEQDNSHSTVQLERFSKWKPHPHLTHAPVHATQAHAHSGPHWSAQHWEESYARLAEKSLAINEESEPLRSQAHAHAARKAAIDMHLMLDRDDAASLIEVHNPNAPFNPNTHILSLNLSTSSDLVGYTGGVGGVALRRALTTRVRPAKFPSFLELFNRLDADGTYTISAEEWQSELSTVFGYISLVHSAHLSALSSSVCVSSMSREIMATLEFNGYPGTQLEEFMRDPDLVLHSIDAAIVKRATPGFDEQGRAVPALFVLSREEQLELLDVVARLPRLLMHQFHHLGLPLLPGGRIGRTHLEQWTARVMGGRSSKWARPMPLSLQRCVARNLPGLVSQLLPGGLHATKKLSVTLLGSGGSWRHELVWGLVQVLGSCRTDQLLSYEWGTHAVVLQLPVVPGAAAHSIEALNARAASDKVFATKYRPLFTRPNIRFGSHAFRGEHLGFVFASIDSSGDAHTLSRDDLRAWIVDSAMSSSIRGGRVAGGDERTSMTLPDALKESMGSCLRFGAERLSDLILGALDVNGEPGVQLSEFRTQPSLIHGAVDILSAGCYIEVLANDPAVRLKQRAAVTEVSERRKRFMLPSLGLMPDVVLRALWREYTGGQEETLGVLIDLPRLERTMFLLERQASRQWSDRSPKDQRRLHACFLASIPWFAVSVLQETNRDGSPGLSFDEFSGSRQGGARVQGYVEALVRGCADFVERGSRIDATVGALIAAVEPKVTLCSSLSPQQLDRSFTSDQQDAIKEISLPSPAPALRPASESSVADRSRQLFLLFDKDRSDALTLREVESGFASVVRSHQDALCYPNLRTLHMVVRCEQGMVPTVARSLLAQFDRNHQQSSIKSIDAATWARTPGLVDSMARKLIAECQVALTEENLMLDSLWKELSVGQGIPLPALLRKDAEWVVEEARLQLTPLQGQTALGQCVLAVLGALALEQFCVLTKTGAGVHPPRDPGITQEQLSWTPRLPEESSRLGLKHCVTSTEQTRRAALHEFMAYAVAETKLPAHSSFDLAKAPSQLGSTAPQASMWYEQHVRVSAPAVAQVLESHVRTMMRESREAGFHAVGLCMIRKLNPEGVQQNVLDVWIRRGAQLKFVRESVGNGSMQTQAKDVKQAAHSIAAFLLSKQQALLNQDVCPAIGAARETLSLLSATAHSTRDGLALFDFPGVSVESVDFLPVGHAVSFEEVYSDLGAPSRYLALLGKSCAGELGGEIEAETLRFVRYDLNRDNAISYDELVQVWIEDLGAAQAKAAIKPGSHLKYNWARGLVAGMAHKVLTSLAGFPRTLVSRKVYDVIPNAIPDAFKAMQSMARRAVKRQVARARSEWARIAGGDKAATSAKVADITEAVSTLIKEYAADKKVFDAPTAAKLAKELESSSDLAAKTTHALVQHWTGEASTAVVTIPEFNANPSLLPQRVWAALESLVVPRDTRAKVHTALFSALDLNAESLVSSADVLSYYRSQGVSLLKERGYVLLSRCVLSQLESSAVPAAMAAVVGVEKGPKRAPRFGYTQLAAYAPAIMEAYENVVQSCKAVAPASLVGSEDAAEAEDGAESKKEVPPKPSKARALAVQSRLFAPLFPYLTPVQMHELRLAFEASPTWSALSGVRTAHDGGSEHKHKHSSAHSNPSLSAALDSFDDLVSQRHDVAELVKILYAHYDTDRSHDLNPKELLAYYSSAIASLPPAQVIPTFLCLLPRAEMLAKNVVHQAKSLGRSQPHPVESLKVGVEDLLLRKSPTLLPDSFSKMLHACRAAQSTTEAFNFYDRNLDHSVTAQEVLFVYERVWIKAAEESWTAKHASKVGPRYEAALKIHANVLSCIRSQAPAVIARSFRDMEFNHLPHIQSEEFALQPTRWFDDAVALSRDCEAREEKAYWRSRFVVYDRNHDGWLSRKELANHIESKQVFPREIAARILEKKDPVAGRAARREAACLSKVLPIALDQLLARYAADATKGISLSEFKSNPKMVSQTFKRMRRSCTAHVESSSLVTKFWADWDRNKDGTIDAHEMEQALRFALRDAPKLLGAAEAAVASKCIDSNMASLVHQVFALLHTNGVQGLQHDELDSEDQVAVVHRAAKAVMVACLPRSSAPSGEAAGLTSHSHDVWLGLDSPLQAWTYCPTTRMLLGKGLPASVRGLEASAPVSATELAASYADFFAHAEAESEVNGGLQQNSWGADVASSTKAGAQLYHACITDSLPILSELVHAHSHSGQCPRLTGELIYSFGLSASQRCRRLVWAALADPKAGHEGLAARVKPTFELPEPEWFWTQCAQFSKKVGGPKAKATVAAAATGVCTEEGLHKLLSTLFQHTTVLPTNVYRTKYGPWVSTLPWSPSWLSQCVEERLPEMAAALLRLPKVAKLPEAGVTQPEWNSASHSMAASIVLGFGEVNLACHRQFIAARKPASEVKVATSQCMLQLFTLCHKSCPVDSSSMLELGSGEALLPSASSEASADDRDASLLDLSATAVLHHMDLLSPFHGSAELSALAEPEDNEFIFDGAAAARTQAGAGLPLLLQKQDAFFSESEMEEEEPAAALEVASTLHNVASDEHAFASTAFVETDSTVFASNSALHRALHRARNGVAISSRSSARSSSLNPHVEQQPEKAFELSASQDGGAVVNKMALMAEDSGALQLRVALRVALEDNLMMQVNRTLSRKLSRQLTKRITIALTESVTRKLLDTLSRPIAETTARLAVHSLTPTLTFAISAAVSPSLTRTPHEDYYCWFCEKNQQYCSYCKASKGHTYYADYYRNFYASYYAHYYGKYYALSTDIAQWITLPDPPPEEPNDVPEPTPEPEPEPQPEPEPEPTPEPEPEPEPQEPPSLRGVNFDNDKATLRPESFAILDHAIEVLKARKSGSVLVAGHTDSNASNAYNQGLSERRANTVKQYLIKGGVTVPLVAKGFGEEQPIDTNDTAEGRFNNRRVELSFQD